MAPAQVSPALKYHTPRSEHADVGGAAASGGSSGFKWDAPLHAAMGDGGLLLVRCLQFELAPGVVALPGLFALAASAAGRQLCRRRRQQQQQQKWQVLHHSFKASSSSSSSLAPAAEAARTQVPAAQCWCLALPSLRKHLRQVRTTHPCYLPKCWTNMCLSSSAMAA